MSSFKAGKTIDSPSVGKKKTLSKGGGDGEMSADSAGIKSGLSERSALNTSDTGPKFDTERNKLTGNATERRKPVTYTKVAGGFEIEK
jgi:hypothetical protein